MAEARRKRFESMVSELKGQGLAGSERVHSGALTEASARRNAPYYHSLVSLSSCSATFVRWHLSTFVRWHLSTFVRWHLSTFVRWHLSTFVRWHLTTFVR